jgi:hypothetical protein
MDISRSTLASDSDFPDFPLVLFPVPFLAHHTLPLLPLYVHFPFLLLEDIRLSSLCMVDTRSTPNIIAMAEEPSNLEAQVEALTRLLSQLVARDTERRAQDDQAIQIADAIALMTNAVERLARNAATDRTEDSDEEVERPDPVATEEADPRFQPLFRSDAYSLTNRRSRVTTREVARLT